MEFEKSRIEKLKRSLYSRNQDVVPKDERGTVHSEDYEIPKNWGDEPSFDMPPEVMTKKSSSFFNKFFLFSISFFALAMGIAAFIFFGGFNMISSNNVDIKVSGSNSAASGETLDLNIAVLNQNSTDLENTILYIEYPDGVEQVTEKGNISRSKIDIGTLKKGSLSNTPLKVLFFGEKDSVKSVLMRIEYTVSGSNAVFTKEKTYEVTINSSPIIMDVSYPKEINSGQEVVLNIDLTSNSNIPITNTLVKVEYPYGFTYTDSSIKPYKDNSLWKIGDLKNGDKKSLVVKGTLVGQNMEDRSFRVSTGMQSADPSKDIDTDLAVNQLTVGIRKSFFNLSVSTGNTGKEPLGQDINRSISLNIGWQNTLPDKVLNSNIVVKLSGNVFDKAGVSVSNAGYYKSLDGTILWDKNTTSSLAELSPLKGGNVGFSLAALSSNTFVRSVKNPHIDMDITMTGDRTGLDAATVSSSIQKTIKFNSNVNLVAKTHRNVSGITTSGPIPPKVESETTYAITWTISNTTNDLKDTVVTATLPVGIEWKGEYSPSDKKISYDSSSRVITWQAGVVSAGSGYTYSPVEVSFKVGVTPSSNQAGQIIQLSSPASLSSLDTYTGDTLRVTSGEVYTTYFDSGASSSDGIVK